MMKKLRQLFCRHRLIKLGEVSIGIVGPRKRGPFSIYICDKCDKGIMSEQRQHEIYRQQCYAPGCEDVGTSAAAILDLETGKREDVWLCGYHNRHKELIGNEPQKPKAPKKTRSRTPRKTDGVRLKRSTGSRMARTRKV